MDAPNSVVVLLALITAVASSIISPIVIAVIAGINRRADDARQDKVARDLADSNARKEALAKENAAKLEEIHILVNSAMTAQMQARYEVLINLLALMNDAVTRNRKDGIEPTVDVTDAIAETASKIGALRKELDDRHRQQKSIDLRNEVMKAAQKSVADGVVQQVEIVGQKKSVEVKIANLNHETE